MKKSSANGDGQDANATRKSRIEHPVGYWQKEGENWIEYPMSPSGKHYTFTEFMRDEVYVYLVDKSRNRDSGRPMILRLPLHGGMAQWSFPNPLAWEDLTIVKPNFSK